ncbi:hypothetical protein ACD578_05295 [Microvirga sp. RSM25]|uniref:hypothetical protein n=1 Tax=Microvirga sp. RSM25 TaxID=3273802 RepID=UPI00384F154E
MRKRQVKPAGAVPKAFLSCADRLLDMADGVKPSDARSGLLHLADLYRHCPTFYPNLTIREGDGLPMRASSASAAGFGSPGAMCMEG